MTDEEIKDAHEIIRQRMLDPKMVTMSRYDLRGDISRYLLGDERIDRADLVQRIEAEIEKG